LLGDDFIAAQQMIIKTLANNFRKLGISNPTEEAKLFFAQIDGMVALFLVDKQHFNLQKMQKALLKKY
jgi:hypothetical protein